MGRTFRRIEKEIFTERYTIIFTVANLTRTSRSRNPNHIGIDNLHFANVRSLLHDRISEFKSTEIAILNNTVYIILYYHGFGERTHHNPTPSGY